MEFQKIELTNHEVVNSPDRTDVLKVLLANFSMYKELQLHEAPIGEIVGKALSNLDFVSVIPNNAERKDVLRDLLWDLIPGKDKFTISGSKESGYVLGTVERDKYTSRVITETVMGDRDNGNQLPRIFVVFRSGMLGWLLTTESDIFERFVDDVRSGRISPHFISKDEILRDANKKIALVGGKNVQVPPATDVFIRAIQKNAYEEAMRLVNDTFDLDEVTVDRLNGKRNIYPMTDLSKK